jgi:hypothetical protein
MNGAIHEASYHGVCHTVDRIKVVLENVINSIIVSFLGFILRGSGYPQTTAILTTEEADILVTH